MTEWNGYYLIRNINVYISCLIDIKLLNMNALPVDNINVTNDVMSLKQLIGIP